jgi:hypothetical protein
MEKPNFNPSPVGQQPAYALFILGNLGGVLFVILSTLIFLKLYSPNHNPSGSTDSVKKYACSPRGEIILNMDSLTVANALRRTLLSELKASNFNSITT